MYLEVVALEDKVLIPGPAVRITHIPTGIVVSQQDEKSQIRNKEKGLKILRSRIYEFERNKRDEERAKDRKSKIGSGDRSKE